MVAMGEVARRRIWAQCHKLSSMLIFLLAGVATDSRANEPQFKLDPDFVYFSGDGSSLLNLKYYPKTKGEYEKIYGNLKKGLETSGESVMVMNLALGLDRNEELAKLGKFALKRDSRKDEARLLLAVAALRSNQPEAAALFLNHIRDKALASGVANARGIIAHQQRKSDQAVRIFRDALRKDQKNYALEMNLGLILMDNQMFEAAEKHLSDVVKRHPKGYDAKLNLALALAGLGKKTKALELLQNLKELFPSSEAVNAALTAVNKARRSK